MINGIKHTLGIYETMKFIQSLIQKVIQKDKKVLGRWNIEYCDKKINNKIDLSNEDHCGPCGQYILDKTVKDTKEPKPKR
jgi:hypothetical protein